MDLTILIGLLLGALGALYMILTSRQRDAEAVSGFDSEKRSDNAGVGADDDDNDGLHRITILYGSQSGTAEAFAEEMGKEAKPYGFKAKVIDLENFDHEMDLVEEKFVVFLLATFGEGDPTDSATNFWEWLHAGTNLRDGIFSEMSIAVFGLGNRQYEHFSHVGHQVSLLMVKYGASEVLEEGEGDDDGSLEDDFEEWKSKFWSAARAHFGEVGEVGVIEKTFDPTIKVRFLEESSDNESDRSRLKNFRDRTAKLDQPNFRFDPKHHGEFVRVRANRELLQKPTDTISTRHIEFDLTGVELAYKTADNLGVYPRSDSALVERMAKRLELDLDAVFCWCPLDGGSVYNHKLHMPATCTVRDVLTWYCDLNGQPKRAILETIAIYAREQADKDTLMGWTAEQKAQYHDLKLNIVDVMERCKSVQVPFGHFLEFSPKMQPRFYTISSSSMADPQSLHATVALDVADKPESDDNFVGVCSRYLCSLRPGKDVVPVFVRASTFVTPWSNMAESKLQCREPSPLVMIGPGTGVAPFHAFLQEAAFLKKQGTRAIGECTLFFGCRRNDEDWIYRDEMEKWLDDGVLNRLITAFSREDNSKNDGDDGGDRRKKTYVQHRLVEHEEMLWEHMDKRHGYIYVCGGTQMGRDVKGEFHRIVAKFKGCSDKEAHTYVQDLVNSNRFIQELWS